MLTSEKDLLRDTLQFDVLKKSQQVYAAQFTGTWGIDTPISSSIVNEKKIREQLTLISCLCLYRHNA